MTNYRGVVLSTSDKGVYVKIPHLDPTQQYGPYQQALELELKPGNQVLLAQVEQIEEDFVIVARIGNKVTQTSLQAADPTKDEEVSTQNYVKNQITAVKEWATSQFEPLG